MLNPALALGARIRGAALHTVIKFHETRSGCRKNCIRKNPSMRIRSQQFIVAPAVPILVTATRSQARAQPRRHGLDPATKASIARKPKDDVPFPLDHALLPNKFCSGSSTSRRVGRRLERLPLDRGQPGVQASAFEKAPRTLSFPQAK